LTYYLVAETTASELQLLGNTTGTAGIPYLNEIIGSNNGWDHQGFPVLLPAFDITSTPLPEPATPALAGIGLILTGPLRRRRT
jgi:hypothetical protein